MEREIMRKIITALLFICLGIVLAYGGACYWIGGQVLIQHNQMLAQVNGYNFVEASNKGYDRGIFSSSAITSFTLRQPGWAYPIKFGLINSIHHGPLVFLRNRHLKGGLQPALAIIHTQLAPDCCSDDMKKLLEKIPELQSSEAITVISLDGGAETYCDVPSFRKTLTNDKNETIEVQWGGFGAETKFNVQLGEASGSYSAPSLQVADKDELLCVQTIRGDFKSHRGMKGISVGSMVFSTEDVKVVEKGETSFDLNSFELKAESGFSGEAVNCSMQLDFDKLTGDGMVVGPLMIEFEARKLAAEVLARFESMSPELRKKASENVGDTDEEMNLFVRNILVDLLAGSPEFEIKRLNIRTDKGDLSGRAKVAFSGLGEIAALNILTLLGSIDASAELSVSEALFFLIAENALRGNEGPGSAGTGKLSAGELAKGLLAQHIMVQEDGAFRSSATYKHGRLSVNGRKMNFSGILGGR
jgi:uncharacterized protein YdgA (DUF945 family)